ncbi:MAG: gamma subclass chorismate mutase AroQ [Proteobacteria bacterium]|nr:gamma subclass chorismate mutase AroQ [Pseudomonadota bacterium]
MWRTALLCLACLAQPVFAGEHYPGALYTVIGDRLALMKEVAAWKWQRNLPVEDIEREKLVIEKAVSAGLDQAITVASSQRFFTAQIDAAKAVQQCWFQRWQQTGPDISPRDLNQVIRPALLELGNAINEKLTSGPHDRQAFNAAVITECLPDANGGMLFEAIEQVSFYSTRLDQVLDSGLLRVGTTGDYAPFSFQAPSGDLSGIDIDMAENLADSLGVTVSFVPTSWPDLMRDLSLGRYDIAMSGVSRTVARARLGYFSSAYHTGGKTPITTCDRKDVFSALEEIDQPGIRIIVNPGGTNEKFLDAHIRQATKLLHGDNRTIFDEIIAGRADLMITDAIEVTLQTRLHPELCAAMPNSTLTFQEKGYLMPRDEALRSVVNLWLDQRRGDGTLGRVFEAHLSP